MKTILFIIVGLIFLSESSFSQQQIGVRGGVYSNVSYRTFMDPSKAVELMLVDRYNGMQVTILSEQFKPTLFHLSDKLFMYTGFGAHVGFSSEKYRYDYHDDTFSPRRAGPLAGVDLACGLEYRWDKYPITIALDYNPFAELSFVDVFKLNVWNTGLTIRYSFK